MKIKKSLKLVRRIWLFFLFSPIIMVYSQTDQDNCSLAFTIPQVALVDIEPSGLSNISLTLTTNPESGLPVSASGAINSNLWINYTSCLASGSNNRSVTVQVSSGSIPSGITLSLLPSAYSGSGKGTMGTPVGTVTLSSIPQTLISGIGRCYTGNGQNNGHQLSYSLSVSDYDLLRYQTSSLQIAFTITDN